MEEFKVGDYVEVIDSGEYWNGVKGHVIDIKHDEFIQKLIITIIPETDRYANGFAMDKSYLKNGAGWYVEHLKLIRRPKDLDPTRYNHLNDYGIF